MCNAGPIEVDFRDGVARAGIPHNFHHHQAKVSEEEVWALHPALKKAGRKPKAVDVVSPVKGMNFLCIELADLETLGLLDTSGPETEFPLDADWDVGLRGSFLYVVISADDDVVKIQARMIQASLEDPATGSASCGLSALLAMRLKLARTTKFEITQGVEMGRQSDIGVKLTLKESMDAVDAIELSGSAVKVMEGAVEYD